MLVNNPSKTATHLLRRGWKLKLINSVEIKSGSLGALADALSYDAYFAWMNQYPLKYASYQRHQFLLLTSLSRLRFL